MQYDMSLPRTEQHFGSISRPHHYPQPVQLERLTHWLMWMGRGSMTPQLFSVELDKSECDGEGDAIVGLDARLIQPELEWFSPPPCESVPIIPSSQVILARWAMPESPCPIELSSRGGRDFHTLTAFLPTSTGRWSFGGKLFFEGRV